MSKKLDRATVAGLKDDDGKGKIVFDSELTGFGVRVRTDSQGRLRRNWIIQYRIGKQQRRTKLGDFPTVSDVAARKKAKELLAKVQLGQDPQAEKDAEREAASTTLKSVVDEYLQMKRHAVQTGSYRASSYRVTELYLTGAYFKPLHSTPIDAVTRKAIATRLNAITIASGAPTASRCRAALTAFYTWSMTQGLAEANPCIGTANPDSAPARDRVLSNVELARLWHACQDDDFGRIIKLLMLTGCRREEIAGLRWSEIFDDMSAINLPKERTKNKNAHTVPLATLAAEIIASIPRRVDRDFVFGERSTGGFTGWWKAQRALEARLGEIAEWHPHDIRRSVATGMADLGVEPHYIEAVLNHRSGHKAGVAGVYNRSKYANQIKAALGMWADHVRSLIDGNARKVVVFPVHN